MKLRMPCYVIEEHHEAFYYWGVGVEKGDLNPRDNVLFHVDHHDDLECGGYFHDFTRPFASLEERQAFTYECLGIADFIVPALYEGLFDVFYNMKGLIPRDFCEEEKFVKLVGENSLTMGNYVPFLHSTYRKTGESPYRFFSCHTGSLSQTPPMEYVALDIDLDYFCWDDCLLTAGEKRLEITRQAYEAYRNDPYHPFRILPRKLLRAKEQDGHFYICYEEVPVRAPQADEDRIRKRVTHFFNWLEAQPWEPAMITVCRSVHSGYLPRDRAPLVERLVTEGLERLWN